MAGDIRELLRDTSEGPTRPLDATALVKRARRQVLTARGLAATCALALIVGAVVSLPRFGPAELTPEIADRPDRDTEPAPRQGEDGIEQLWDRSFQSVAVNEHGAARPLVEGTRVRLQLRRDVPARDVEAERDVAEDANGYAVWHAGCNTGSSEVVVSDGRIEPVGFVGSTLVLCWTDELTDQDRWIHEFFRNGPTWRLQDDRLVLRSGEVSIVLEPTNAGPAPGVPPTPLVGEPTHAVFTTQAGELIGVDLTSGERTELAGRPPAPGSRFSTVFDLAVSDDSSFHDFTAIAYDDGDVTGFVTYVRRDGGDVQTSFTPVQDLPATHSNRGFRTISPDGTLLAYQGSVPTGGGASVRLVPIDQQTGQLDLDAETVLDVAAAPVSWTGPVAAIGDRSLLVHHRTPSDPDNTATVIERTADGFEAVTEITLEPSTPANDDDGGVVTLPLEFGAIEPGSPDDARFTLTVDRDEVEIGERPDADIATVTYAGPAGTADVTFELHPRVGNLAFDAAGHTALVVIDTGPWDPDVTESEGAAWTIRADDRDGPLALTPTAPIVRGVLSGALLNTPTHDRNR